MEINLNDVKVKAIEFDEKLRFPIDALKIDVNGKWKELKILTGIYETPGGQNFFLSPF